MKDCIYVTDPDWIASLRGDAAEEPVNFWRKDPRAFTLDSGAYFYFKPRGERVVVGRARFERYEKNRVEDAWRTYGRRNGVGSLDELLERASRVLRISDPRHAELGCIILTDLQWLPSGKQFAVTPELFPEAGPVYRTFERSEQPALAACFEHNHIDAISPRPSSEADEFLSTMRRYCDAHIVFASPARGVVYSVRSFDETGCVVDRLSANEPARVTVAAFESAFHRLQARGGRAALADLSSTVAIASSFTQSPRLAITPDRQTVVYIRDAEAATGLLCEYVPTLRVDRSGTTEKLYKPAMLACVVEAIDAGELNENRITFDSILPRFLQKMRDLGQDVTDQQAAEPFVRLTSDVLWLLACHDPANAVRLLESPSPGAIRHTVRHALLKETFWAALQDPMNRHRVSQRLAEHWWPAAPPWDLRPGDTIRRVDLHRRYDGNGQSGIAPSARTPNVFLFTDLASGKPHGYIYDGWEEGRRIFLYTGEGQEGDQTLTGGNRAILEHRQQGRALRLFEGARGDVRYVGEFELDDPPYDTRTAPASGGSGNRSVLVFRLRPVGVSAEPGSTAIGIPAAALVKPTLASLAKTTLWTEEALEELVQTVTGPSPQIVLAGPPGTSKTWVAKALATYLTGARADSVRMVQFHPSYTYEQFIEGLRPVVRAGAIQFERVDGVVLDLVRTMKPANDRRVLIIDEMNRANLPKVLGELLYLFEYRHETIHLQYSPQFQLPLDLLFIGTMNTADRSIRSIDIALRRRFDVFECTPDRALLERYYAAGHRNEVPDLLDGFEKLNAALEAELDRHHTIGHAFFMADPMTPDRLRHVWKHKIGPLIEEYFFDRSDLAAAFTSTAYWPSLKSP